MEAECESNLVVILELHMQGFVFPLGFVLVTIKSERRRSKHSVSEQCFEARLQGFSVFNLR